MRLSVALPVVALVLAAGCGSGGSADKVTLTNDYAAALRASVDKTTGTSSKMALTVTTTVNGKDTSFVGEGAFASSKDALGSMQLHLGRDA